MIDSLPFFAECKRESYDLLAATPGKKILEVGCGLGDDAAALAARVAPGGSVVAVDGSQAMVDAARKRHDDIAGLLFEVADATQLPYETQTFDACRIDRVLQHIPDPAAAIREMVRVLRPGGVLVAFDNDWETLTVDSPDRMLTRTVLNAWCDRFPSGWSPPESSAAATPIGGRLNCDPPMRPGGSSPPTPASSCQEPAPTASVARHRELRGLRV